MVRRTTNGAVALGLVLAVATGGWATAQEAGKARPFCDFPGTYTDWSNLTYKGVRMVVPTAYERHERAVRDGRSVDGIGGHYVAVWVDDFAPVLSRDVRRRAADPSWMTLLVNKLKPIPEIARGRAGLYSGNRAKMADFPAIGTYPTTPGPHGLTEVAYDGTIADRFANGTARGMFRTRALYVDHGTDGTVDLIVECRHEDVLVQLCEQFFEVGPFTITMTYLRSELPNWDRFRRDTERLIACATELGREAEACDEAERGRAEADAASRWWTFWR